MKYLKDKHSINIPKTTKLRPKGELKIISTDLNQSKSIAIYPEIIMIDEAGYLWKQKSASFLFDLTLVGKEK